MGIETASRILHCSSPTRVSFVISQVAKDDSSFLVDLSLVRAKSRKFYSSFFEREIRSVGSPFIVTSLLISTLYRIVLANTETRG